MAGIAFNHPYGACDALDSAHAGDDRPHAYVPARHMGGDDDGGDDDAHHVHAYGCDAPHHDARNVELRDLLLLEDVSLLRRGLLVLSLS